MLASIRNSAYIRFFWGLMGVYLLNISVDTADPDPPHVPEDLSINDQESIVEFIIEKILGFEDAIEEYDDTEPEDNSKKKNGSLLLAFLFTRYQDDLKNTPMASQERYPTHSARLTQGHYQLDIPPPKV